jgi:acyl-CoA reductase-like NAD-dependent aldehyde dehydrogenase
VNRAAKGASRFGALTLRPANNSILQLCRATAEDVETAILASSKAFDVYSKTSGAERSSLLGAIDAGLDSASDELVNRAHLETALPLARLKGEVLRTSNQLRLFAGVVEEGLWVSAISTRCCQTVSYCRGLIFGRCFFLWALSLCLEQAISRWHSQ